MAIRKWDEAAPADVWDRERRALTIGLLLVVSSWWGLAWPAFARLNKAKDGMASSPRVILQGRLLRQASRRWTLPSSQRHQGTEGRTGWQVQCGAGNHERVPVRCTRPALILYLAATASRGAGAAKQTDGRVAGRGKRFPQAHRTARGKGLGPRYQGSSLARTKKPEMTMVRMGDHSRREWTRCSVQRRIDAYIRKASTRAGGIPRPLAAW